MKFTICLFITLMFCSCGSVQISARRYSRGLHIETGWLQKKQPYLRADSKKHRTAGSKLDQSLEEPCIFIEKKTEIQSGCAEKNVQLINDNQAVVKTADKKTCVQNPQRLSEKKKNFCSVKQGKVAHDSAHPIEETSFSALHIITLIFSVLFVTGFLLFGTWIDALLFIVLAILAIVGLLITGV
ncbi:MAG: hypothetical protein JNL57_02450 [Bacteroidetes bacterium]|nr:hypothetical protein [Bacteroidota bacterium]